MNYIKMYCKSIEHGDDATFIAGSHSKWKWAFLLLIQEEALRNLC